MSLGLFEIIILFYVSCKAELILPVVGLLQMLMNQFQDRFPTTLSTKLLKDAKGYLLRIIFQVMAQSKGAMGLWQTVLRFTFSYY